MYIKYQIDEDNILNYRADYTPLFEYKLSKPIVDNGVQIYKITADSTSLTQQKIKITKTIIDFTSSYDNNYYRLIDIKGSLNELLIDSTNLNYYSNIIKGLILKELLKIKDEKLYTDNKTLFRWNLKIYKVLFDELGNLVLEDFQSPYAVNKNLFYSIKTDYDYNSNEYIYLIYYDDILVQELRSNNNEINLLIGV